MSETQAPNSRPEPRRRWLRRLLIGAAIAVAVVVAAGAVLSYNTQILVGAFQGYQSKNSFEPRNPPSDQMRADGVRYVNDLEYGTEYPNSHLDISYPADAPDGPLPTIVFTHGGGFFAGDKVLADPLAIDSDVNFLFDRFLEQGFAFVNVNYALVPEYHFPTPVEQLDQALAFLKENAADYQLDMDNVIIMGSSAGAIMTAQYGAALSNVDYAKDLGVMPSLDIDSVRALIIDDAPLAIDDFGFSIMLLVGNYIDGTMHPSAEDRARYDPIDDVTGSYPPSFLIGSNYDGDGYAHDMGLLSTALEAKGVEHDFFYERYNDGSEPHHGLLGGLSSGDPIAKHAFDDMMAFLDSVPATSPDP
ncbi:alpha/beta hydrolase [Nocardioides sambongensis]|uniref:alpha/beta hydrolase n=1 Tax=Nocardioides sambongensis TaxID=2589074 RepID=UPI0011282E03|nr:alpha/beta hydrolase [Nocardioides sambongensis]